MSWVPGRHAARPVLQQFLAQLVDPCRPIMDARHVAVVVAHPDDETIGCGGQLLRWRSVSVVVVTDGAPRTISADITHDFGSPEKYAAERTNELLNALSIAGVPVSNVERFGLCDQQAAFRLQELSVRLADFLYDRDIEIAITHAYEGGHPDHDATAFAVHRARRLMKSRGRGLAILETPFYRAGKSGWLLQNFFQAHEGNKVRLQLTEDEQARKLRMLAAHVSQREMLAHFSTEAEYFRSAPNYDFTKPPNSGDVFYERHDWGVTASSWCELTKVALAELDSGSVV